MKTVFKWGKNKQCGVNLNQRWLKWLMTIFLSVKIPWIRLLNFLANNSSSMVTSCFLSRWIIWSIKCRNRKEKYSSKLPRIPFTLSCLYLFCPVHRQCIKSWTGPFIVLWSTVWSLGIHAHHYICKCKLTQEAELQDISEPRILRISFLL